MTANRPPRDITPARFFTDWLPREFGSEFGTATRARRTKRFTAASVSFWPAWYPAATW